MDLAPKPASASRTIQTQILLSQHINGSGRLFGGQLMQWINDTILLEGVVTYVGRTSMEVRVDTFVENLNGERHMINRAYLVLVALDENDHSTPVPPLLLETDEERAEWEAGKRRSELRKQRKAEQF